MAEGARALAVPLSRLQSLTKLSLGTKSPTNTIGGNSIGPAGAQEIAQALGPATPRKRVLDSLVLLDIGRSRL